MIEAIRRQSGPPVGVAMWLVLASQPETTEAGPLYFTWRNVSYDALSVAGDLRYEDVYHERCPDLEFTPTSFPGLF